MEFRWVVVDFFVEIAKVMELYIRKTMARSLEIDRGCMLSFVRKSKTSIETCRLFLRKEAFYTVVDIFFDSGKECRCDNGSWFVL